MQILYKALLVVTLLTLFIYIVFNIPYPNSLTEANFYQLITFFGVFLLLTISLINIVINYILVSVPIGLGLTVLLMLKGLDSLNLVSVGLVLIAVWLFASYFKKNQKKKPKSLTGSNPIKTSLTSRINIPKLRSLGDKK